jgi:hypothetical protein
LLCALLAALDFQEDIKSDRKALAAAAKLKKGERMSDESAGALRRKVGGTKSGFFGETVDAKGKYLEQGYVSTRPTEVPYIPVLIVVGALLHCAGLGCVVREDASRALREC